MTVPASRWPPPPVNLTLGDDEVHIWCVPLNLSTPDIRRLEQTLASDERRRAKRYYWQGDRERFIAARGLLRAILSRYLGVEASLLRFRYGPNGKPLLLDDRGWDALQFNL